MSINTESIILSFVENTLKPYSKDLSDIDWNKLIKLLEIEINDHELKEDEVRQTIIRVLNNLITEDNSDYQYLAGRLFKDGIYQKVYLNNIPSPLYMHLLKGVNKSLYAKHTFSQEDLTFLDSIIDHDRDNNLTYAAWQQLSSKYLIQDRYNKTIFESPQMMYMLIAMYGFEHYPHHTRLQYIEKFYHAISLHKISLPTPILCSLRTPFLQGSSCVLIDVGDSIDSIANAVKNIMKYTSYKAGFGINIGEIRGIGSPIRGGISTHAGYIPYISLLQSAIKACSQGGIRNGAATVFYPIWNIEIESLITLKNNRGNEGNRVRHLDYAVQISRLFYKRLLEGQNISLFSSSEVPGLYENFFQDNLRFEKLYVEAENNPLIRRKSISAIDLFTLILTERAQTGRIYIQNVDHCNKYSTFNHKAPSIKGSNLCMEILLPTTPVSANDQDSYEMALCTLASLNLGTIEMEEIEDIADLTVRFLDEILEYQHYPIIHAEISTRARRSLGIGVTNFAYFLAKNHLSYNDKEARNLVHRTFERIQYYLLVASNKLAKEKGACERYSETTYADNVICLDNYKTMIDSFHTQDLLCDWDKLRANIKLHGVRHSTLTSLMPCEASSIVSNSTNGIEPPRGPVSVKQNKEGVIKCVVPEYKKLKQYYTFLWKGLSNTNYLILCGIMQKFIDQSISANTNYNPNVYPDRMISMKDMIKDLIFAYQLGIKTLYYHNTLDEIEIETILVNDCGCKL